MRAFRFAVRSLLRQPGRTSLGILGIAAVGALLFDMLLLSRGLVVSFRDLLDSVGFDVRVSATQSPLPGGVRLPDATATADALGALPQVAEVVPLRTADAETYLAGRWFGFSVMGVDPGTRRPWTVIGGDDLDTRPDDGMLVNEALHGALAMPVGARLQVRVLCDGSKVALVPREFQIVGTAQFPFDSEGALTAVLSRRAVRQACDDERDQADMLMVASRDGAGAAAAVAAIRAARPDLFPVTNEDIVARMQAQNFTYFRQISSVLSTITLLFGFLLITVLLTVSVNQRLAEIAALRALGFSRQRAAADVLWQGGMLVGIGGVLALPLGLALSVWLDGILKTMPGIPAAMHFFEFEPRALAMHIVLLVSTALLASAYPMWLVATLPIATTLRNEVVS
jgi:ABC-type lipoprotein release transport system permease subunit